MAVTVAAEVGELTRVDHPRPLMRDVGLTPSAYSSGARRRQDSMTQTGNTQACRALVEGAWASRDPANVSRHLHLRLEKRPKAVQEISGKAPGRLGTRDRQRSARRTHALPVVVASARERRACMGAMAQAVPGLPSKAPIVLAQRSNASSRKGRGPGLGSPATA